MTEERRQSRSRRRGFASADEPSATDLTRLPGRAARPARWLTLSAAGIIVAAGLLAYANSFWGPFIFDDINSISNNPTIRRLWPIAEAITPPSGRTVAGRPMVNLSLAVNYRISGLDVWSYHALNLAVHLAAGLLLFGIIRRTLLTKRLEGAFGGGAAILAALCGVIWVVHPLQTQAVTYVIQRAESMMGLFYLLTLYCAVRGLTSRHAAWWYVPAVAACAAGMGTKEVMVTAPIIVLLYDCIFVSRSLKKALKERWAFYAGLAATWVILVGILWTAPRSQSAGLGLEGLTPLGYAQIQCKAIIHYIRLAFWPRGLVFDYTRRAVKSFGEYGPGGLCILALLGATVAALRYRPALGFLGAWFFVILGPTSSFVPIADAMFEHRMYLSLAAVVAGVVLGAYALSGRLGARARPVRVAGLVVVLAAAVALGLTTRRRNEDYRQGLTIWQDTVAKQPDNFMAWTWLAGGYLSAKEYPKAIEACSRAIRLHDGFAPTYQNRATAYRRLGRYDLAIADHDKAIRLDPGYFKAYRARAIAHLQKGNYQEAIDDLDRTLQLGPAEAETYYNRGVAYHRAGRHDLAIADFDAAIALNHRYALAYNARGVCYGDKEDHARAVSDLDQAIRLNPTFPTTYKNKDSVLQAAGRGPERIQNLRQAVRNVSDWPEALSGLAWLLAVNKDAKLRSGVEAVALAQRACELTGHRSPEHLKALAAACAETGQFEKAVEVAQRAAALAARAGDQQLAKFAGVLAETYRRRSHYRQ